ncbi:Hypothetical Protein FCC1311_019872 [Hondaea fermentalgiana]|uniref:Uncharacterized protein n=1 Tax=Hondaea fermentalgiana TaxID=2315210 RepID=A0A2R5G7J7_9STRA|nr:Hypothetical Protein FCC1311_019872 [Hondaea fermentalgiana]|eukprot:GBG25768.1 Hypothetical Protein FCC1311_019872 [Hondaea fermentalgiana]
MEVLVVAGEQPTGLHYALTLCRAKERRQVPESKDGRQIIVKVHVVVDGHVSERARAVERAGEDFVVDGDKVDTKGTLCVHHAQDFDKADLAWVKRCKPFFLMPRPWEVARWTAWAREHAQPGTVVACMHPCLDHIGKILEVFDEKSQIPILFGAPFYAASFRNGDNAICASSLGSILLARIPRGKQHLSMQTQAIEAPGTHNLWYCDDTYRNNWLFGTFMWRLFDAYAALLFDPARPRSFHEQLAADGGLHRRALLALFDEALVLIPKKERSLIEFVGSPLALSLSSTRLLLRMPDPIFSMLQGLWPMLTLTGFVSSCNGVHHGDADALRAAPFFNGFVVEQTKKLIADGLAGATEPSFNAFLVEQSSKAHKATETAGKIPLLAPADIEPHLQKTPLFSLPVALCIVLAVLACIFIVLPGCCAVALNIILPNEAKFL